MLQLDQASLGMPSREYYLKGRDDRPLMAYENLARSVATVLGADTQQAETEMKEMVDFEIELAKVGTWCCYDKNIIIGDIKIKLFSLSDYSG